MSDIRVAFVMATWHDDLVDRTKLGFFERMAELQARVAAEITTTFASGYAGTISLDDVLDPEVARAYSAQATGEKRLITPAS